jgi:23S rRNA (cytidine1920-2'-O)/16S rRNA (cytidine1409-2'-O)-methyltransferase
VRSGLAPDERVARAMIMSHQVLVNDSIVTKPGTPVRPSESIRVRGQARKYASRGGEKLERALRAFRVDVGGQVALDAGASAGGFTDCLLEHGAARVFAVDVGYGQLHSRLANDERVTALERTNISDLRRETFGTSSPRICTVDLSYLSLAKAVPVLEAVIAEDAVMICLVKPLYEGLEEKSFRAPRELHGVLLELLARLDQVSSRSVAGCVASPITGGNGSIEFLLLLRPGPRSTGHSLLVDQALAEAVQRHGL